MESLTQLFGGDTRVKLLRLFLFNKEGAFLLSEIAERAQCKQPAVRREINALLKASFIKKKIVSKTLESKHGSSIPPKNPPKKVSGTGYALNEKFPYLEPLKNLLTVASISADESLVRRFAPAGRIKLIVAAGVFIQNWDSRVDLLLVGDDINLSKVESVIRGIEAEVGKEISYSAFESQDFEYRMGIHDRLVRDILDYPHVTLLDRLNIESQ